MRFDSTSLADDTPAMCAALEQLTEARIRFQRKTRYQIKVGDLSFYPDKGTIFRDGDRQALDARGLDQFLSLARPD